MEGNDQIRELVKQIRPEDRYPLWQYLRWYHIYDDMKQMVKAQGWYCDEQHLICATDHYVYYGGMDPATPYWETLRIVWVSTLHQSGQLQSYGEKKQFETFHAQGHTCMERVLGRLSDYGAAYVRQEEGLLELKEGARDLLYAILSEPVVQQDMKSYLARKKQKPDHALIARAARYYVYEAKQDWNKTYWESIGDALEYARKTKAKQEGTYQMLVISKGNGQGTYVPCRICSDSEDFSLVSEIRMTAKAYVERHPEREKKPFTIQDFLALVPGELCKEHGFWPEGVYPVVSVNLLDPEKSLVTETGEKRIKRRDAWDYITAYVYNEMDAEPSHTVIWDQIHSLRNAVCQACYFDDQDTVSAAAFLTAVEDYRRIHFTEEWGPFQWADMPAL